MKTSRQSLLQIMRAFVLLAACLLPGILLSASHKVETSQVQDPDFAAPMAYEQRPPVNAWGAPVRDAEGCGINYTREELGLPKAIPDTGITAESVASVASVTPEEFLPSAADRSDPFWKYSIFGSGIGASNIIISPAAGGSGAPEIIIGGNSFLGFGPDDFWQVVRRNSATGNYDQLFVSPLYSAGVKRIVTGNIVGDFRREIAVMLANGRVFLYDLATKAELGSINTGLNGLEGLSLTDLDGDGLAELIVTTANDLYIYSNTGLLLWQVAGAGGYEVIVGQMDNDPTLEIAATKGTVVDVATHQVQWTVGGGLGSHLRLAPLAGANYQQLIAAEAWYVVYGHDVGAQWSRRWSIQTSHDIGALEVGDVDNDGTPEVLIGENQHGKVFAYDLVTQAQKWAINNPPGGVTNIAVGDVDADGEVDLLWGAGWENTGPDYLYVASTSGTHAIKWQSVDLQGPFLGPVIGDLDGDGRPELVVCSYKSDAGFKNGRILVFDATTLTLRGMSAPVVGNYGTEGVRDFKLRDLEGDGRMEIVLASDRTYDGVIEIYEFNAANAFSLKWTNTMRPVGSPFVFVDVVDLDGNGTKEIVAGNSVAHSGSEGVYVYVYDYPSSGNPWRSVALSSGFSGVTGLVIDNLDGGSAKKIAALVANGDIYTFDGPTRTLESIVQQSGGKMLGRRSPSGLIVVDSASAGHFWDYSNHGYAERFSRQLGTITLDGISVLPDGALWTGAGGAMSLRLPPLYDSVDWQSPTFAPGLGRFVTTVIRDGFPCAFSSGRYAAAGFKYRSPPVSPTPTATPKPGPRPSPTP